MDNIEGFTDIAFLFAGQGAQRAGMGRDLYARSAAARAVWDMCGDSVKALAFDGPAETLNATINAQPCVFAMDLACAAALNEAGVSAAAVAGFSVGEVAAAVHAGVLSARNGLAFINARAQAMERCAAANSGGMFAVLRLSAETVRLICERLPGVYPVNFNCPGQTVAACVETSAVAFVNAVADAGGKAVRVAVSGPFHSPFMDEASASALSFLQKLPISAPNMPIFANKTAQPYGDAARLLSAQINSPVLWEESMRGMIARGFGTFVELGPGSVLSGFMKRIDPGIRVYSVCDCESLDRTVSIIQNGGTYA